jgi:hypothetical protein
MKGKARWRSVGTSYAIPMHIYVCVCIHIYIYAYINNILRFPLRTSHAILLTYVIRIYTCMYIYIRAYIDNIYVCIIPLSPFLVYAWEEDATPQTQKCIAALNCRGTPSVSPNLQFMKSPWRGSPGPRPCRASCEKADCIYIEPKRVSSENPREQGAFSF